VTFVSSREQLFGRDLGVAPTWRLESFDRLVNLLWSTLPLRHEPRDGAAVPCDNHGFATLDVIENLKEAGLSV